MNQTQYDAVILAGGPPPLFAPSLPNKTFIRIRKRPLFMHVLQALIGSAMIDRIYIVGPREELEKALAATDMDIPRDRVIVMQEFSDVVENAWNAFLGSLGPDYRQGDEDNNRETKERAIFVLGGDAPTATTMEIDQFLQRCDTGAYDYFFGMTPQSVLDYYRPTDTKLGIKLAYTVFAEDFLRVNNLHLIKPFMVKNLGEIQEMYRLRHLRNPVNVARCWFGLLQRGLSLGDLARWMQMVLAFFAQKYQMTRLADRLRKAITLALSERIAGNLLGTRAKIVVTTYGGCALDVDRKNNIATIEQNYVEWMAHQERLADRAVRPSMSDQR